MRTSFKCYKLSYLTCYVISLQGGAIVQIDAHPLNPKEDQLSTDDTLCLEYGFFCKNEQKHLASVGYIRWGAFVPWNGGSYPARCRFGEVFA